jgi:hypothetical protein
MAAGGASLHMSAFAAVAKCASSSVIVGIKSLEDAGLLSWVKRITRIRRQEHDLLGHPISIDQVIRTLNAYHLIDPLDRELSQRSYKTENLSGPSNRDFKRTSPAPLVPAAPLAIALRGEHGNSAQGGLSAAERPTLIARLDSRPTKADWALFDRDLDARITGYTANPR